LKINPKTAADQASQMPANKKELANEPSANSVFTQQLVFIDGLSQY
jgi:hypothetical protein